MGNQEGKESASVVAAVEQWVDENEKGGGGGGKNDDDSFASHSRTIRVDRNDNDDENSAISRSRSIDIFDDAPETEEETEELTDSQRDSRSSFVGATQENSPKAAVDSSLETSQRTTDEEELTNSQRTSRSNFVSSDDTMNGLMANGAPTLSSPDSRRQRQKPYRDRLSLDGISLNYHDGDDDNDSVEMDGLLAGAAPAKHRRKRRRRKKKGARSFCVRLTIGVVVMVVFVLTLVFGAMVFQRRQASKNLRGDNTNGSNSMDSPSADSIFKGKSAMSNTHGLDVGAGSGNCIDNMAYRHDNMAGKNCQWVAKANTVQRCANERILENCRATCDPSCGGSLSSSNNDQIEYDHGVDEQTTFPTEVPTYFPTVSPTELETGWATDEDSDEDSDEDGN